MENSREDNEIDRIDENQGDYQSNTSNVNTYLTDNAPAEEKKSLVVFSSYGILTFWILPIFFGSIFINGPALWFWLTVILSIQAIVRRKPIPVLSHIFYFLSKITFGAKFNEDNAGIPRVWWFLTFGSIFSGILIVLIAITLPFIVPLILLIKRRKQVLRIIFFIAFLPRKELLSYSDPEYEIKRRELLAQYNQAERQYMIFIRPQTLTHASSYFLIIVLPFALLILLAPLRFYYRNYTDLVKTFNENIGNFAVIGLLAVIPYIFLMLPFFGKFKLNRLASTRLGKIIVETITGSAINSLPLFDGEYFIEEESNLIDMSESTGLFAIFGNGRLTTILLTPIALIALIFREVVIRVISSDLDASYTAGDFFERFFDSESLNPVFFSLLIIPIVLTTLLPLILVLSDSEIKRSKWKLTTYLSEHKEINSVEDVGSTINNIFKIILGVGTITSLSNSISVLVAVTSPIEGYVITGILLVLGAALVLPGTIFMVYTHFSSGDHYLSVNYLRYLLSQSPNIATGTIERQYDMNAKLVDPPEDVLSLIQLYRENHEPRS